MKIVDKIIKEPPSGAHNDPAAAAELIKAEVIAAFSELKNVPVDELLAARLQKYRAMGEYKE